MLTKNELMSLGKYLVFIAACARFVWYAYQRATPSMAHYMIIFDYPANYALRNKVRAGISKTLQKRQPVYRAAHELYRTLRREITALDIWYLKENRALLRLRPQRPLVRIDAQRAITQQGKIVDRVHIEDQVWEQTPTIQVADWIAVNPLERIEIAHWWNGNAQFLHNQAVVWRDHTHIELVPDGVAPSGPRLLVTAKTELNDRLWQSARAVAALGNYSTLDLRYSDRIIATRKPKGGKRGGIKNDRSN